MIFSEVILVIPFLKLIISGLYSMATIFFKVLIKLLGGYCSRSFKLHRSLSDLGGGRGKIRIFSVSPTIPFLDSAKAGI